MTQRKRNVIDFDAARKESQRQPARLKAYGTTFDVPASAPMGFVTALGRYEGGDDLGPAEIDELLRLALGAAVIDHMYENGLEVDDLEDLMGLVSDQWSSGGGGSAGEASAPNEGASSNS